MRSNEVNVAQWGQVRSENECTLVTISKISWSRDITRWLSSTEKHGATSHPLPLRAASTRAAEAHAAPSSQLPKYSDSPNNSPSNRQRHGRQDPNSNKFSIHEPITKRKEWSYHLLLINSAEIYQNCTTILFNHRWLWWLLAQLKIINV